MKTLQQLYHEHQGKVSDKWSIYLAEYDRVFAGYRDRNIRLLEIGIQNGGSLEIWSTYFPNAVKLVGCDINPDCGRLTYDSPLTRVVVGDANLDETEKIILGYAQVYDLIIDDGSHRSSDIAKSFVRYFPHLEEGGLFVVEDLHCSYWQEFEGGLFDPYSSVAFFKRLADVINYEHWGGAKSRKDLFAGFSSKYGISFNEECLAHVHSVEFVNSMCFIRKAATECNRLGRRNIAGQQAQIADVLEQVDTLCLPSDQSSNYFSAGLMQHEDDIAKLRGDLAERNIQIPELNRQLQDRDRKILQIVNSRSWKMTAPLRWVRRFLAR